MGLSIKSQQTTRKVIINGTSYSRIRMEYEFTAITVEPLKCSERPLLCWKKVAVHDHFFM
jgi:hypothetical protein